MSAFPKIIYGTAWKAERTTDLVVKAVLQGFRAIDTACQPKHYREDLVGEALSVLDTQHGIKRDHLFIQTKFTSIDGQDRTKPLPYNPDQAIRAQVRESFAKSLTNLQTTRLDALLLHSPLRTTHDTLEAWGELVALRDEGSVKLIGISNIYDPELLQNIWEVSGVKPDIVQNRWYSGNAWDRGVVDFCTEHSIHYESFWTLTGSPKLLRNSTLLSLAQKASCTPEQALFRFAQDMGITPLAGSQNEQRMKDGVLVDTLPALDFELSEQIRHFIGYT
ncbi:Aldo/keto reductase [Clavulina sp. PMI_390]|nr:Aldo/keto reductase [Clavulina sp. PMI_390]